jgi:hypothetical protein
VKVIQTGYQVRPLSAFLGEPVPASAPPIDFYPPLSGEQQRTSLQVFGELNFLLRFCPTHPSEVDLMRRFAQLGIGADMDFNAEALDREIRQAVQDGIADAWQAYDQADEQIGSGELTSGDLFGTREFLENNYLYRMVGAVGGIYGNSRDEAMYPLYAVDATGQPLDASQHRYTLHFGPGQLPPVNAFWSVTMYSFPARLLVDNPLDRYLINSPMLPDLVSDPDGGITLYLQHESPGEDKEANWLPAPDGPFFLVMRLYWPKPEALDGTWTAPPLERVS